MPAQAANFSISARALRSLVSTALRALSARSGLRPPLLSKSALCMLRGGPRELETLLLSGPPARWLRMVYNWRDYTRLEGRTLIGTGPNAHEKGGMLLILIALFATVSYLTGCADTGSGGSQQAPEEQQASRTTGTPEQKSEVSRSSGEARSGRLGHPAIGSPDAPVVLVEYADYQ